MAEELDAGVFSTPAGTFYVDLLNDHLWRGYDEVVVRLRLVVVELAQMTHTEAKSGRSRS